MKLKILHVIDTLEAGGAEKVCIGLFESNHNEMHVDLMVFSRISKGLSGKSRGIIYSGIRENKFSIISAYKVIKILRSYDVIHCHMTHVARYIGVLKFFAHSPKLILHSHLGKAEPHHFQYIYNLDFFIGVDRLNINVGKKVLDLKRKNFFELSNVIFSTNQETIHPTNESCVDLIIVGNIKPIKNQLFAIALAKLVKRKLLIIGNSQDKNYFKEVTLAAQSTRGLVDIVTNVSDVSSYLKRAKLGLMVSLSESGPLVLLEYMKHDLPFVSHKTGGVVEKFSSEYTDIVVCPQLDLELWDRHIKNYRSNDFNKLNAKEFLRVNNEKKYIKQLESIYYSVTKEEVTRYN